MIYANDCYMDVDEYSSVMSAYEDIKRGMDYGHLIDDYPEYDQNFEGLGLNVGSIISGLWSGIKTGVSTVYSGVKSVGTYVWSGAKTIGGTALKGVKSVGSFALTGAKTVGGTLSTAGKYVWNSAKNVANWTVGGNSLIGKGVKYVGAGVKATASWIGKQAGNLWGGIKKGVTNTWNWITGKNKKTAPATIKETPLPAPVPEGQLPGTSNAVQPGSQTGQKIVSQPTVPAEKSIVKENTVVSAGQTIFDMFGKKVEPGTPLTAGTNVYVTNNSNPAIAPQPGGQPIAVSYDPNTGQYYYRPDTQYPDVGQPGGGQPGGGQPGGGGGGGGGAQPGEQPGEQPAGEFDIVGTVMEYAPYVLAGGVAIYLLASKKTSPLRRRATA